MSLPKSRPLNALASTFKTLSDTTRLRLLNLLSEGEVCVCFLCDVLRMVQPKVSRHLASLKTAGLVTARREAQWTHYAWAKQSDPIVRGVMDALRDWLAKDKTFAAERERLKKVCCK